MTEKKQPLRLVDILTPRDRQRIPVGKYVDRWPIQRRNDGRWIYGRLYDERAINYVAALAKERIAHKHDCIILMTGERGKGKSTLAIEVNQAVGEGLTLEDITFQITDFFGCLDKAPFANVEKGIFPRIIPDESGISFYAKKWNTALQQKGVMILEAIRMKGIIITFCAPHSRKINIDIREEMAYIWINIDPPEYLKEDRGYAVVRTGTRDIFKQSIWWFPAFAFFFPELKGPFWESYESKKKTFIDQITAGEVTKSPTNLPIPTDFRQNTPILSS